jgi:DNA-binding XRE family transcriptional regulator
MNKAQRERFQRAGGKVGTVGEFLELTPAEEDLIETKLRLGGLVRALRERSHLSQAALAKRIGSSQPRVAKIESHDPEVSLDLQMRAIFASRPSASRELAALIRKWEAPISVRSPAHTRRVPKARPPLLGRNTKTAA